MSNQKVLVICGPTAVGKTDLSLNIAQKFNGEILSADSRQFFRELNIGTAKPSLDELELVPHHFINSHSIHDDYTAGKFEKDGLLTIKDLHLRGKLPLIVGGSGLYIRALMEGIDQPPSDSELRASIDQRLKDNGLESLQEALKKLDPDKYQSIDLNNPRRVVRALEIAELNKRGLPLVSRGLQREFQAITIVLNRDRPELYGRINARVDKMVDAGLVQEVEKLQEYKDNQAMQTVGYKEILMYLDGDLSLDEAISLIKRNTRRYAKRQITWFKRLEKAHWFHPEDKSSILSFIADRLRKEV